MQTAPPSSYGLHPLVLYGKKMMARNLAHHFRNHLQQTCKEPDTQYCADSHQKSHKCHADGGHLLLLDLFCVFSHLPYPSVDIMQAYASKIPDRCSRSSYLYSAKPMPNPEICKKHLFITRYYNTKLSPAGNYFHGVSGRIPDDYLVKKPDSRQLRRMENIGEKPRPGKSVWINSAGQMR